MCGRFTLKSSARDLAEAFPWLELPSSGMSPRYNVAPSQAVPAVRNDGSRRIEPLRWGLVPFFARDPSIGDRMINARSETAAEKPAFREAFRHRRCLVFADGFYEWRENPGRRAKTPMYVQVEDGRPFAFAGLWESWRGPGEDEPLRSCTILTTEPNERLRAIHDRMPVILREGDVERWIAPEPRPVAWLQPMLAPYPAEKTRLHPVSTVVNDPRHDEPDCVARVADPEESGGSAGPTQPTLFP